MLISVIIPTYNRAQTIERTINSVLAQTWPDMEIIVVDDGSTDRTSEVLKTYGDRIRVIWQRNGGPSAARNAGIKAATGEIISFLDSDDVWLPNKTERQARLLKRTEALGVICCICNARMLYVAGVRTSFQTSRLHPKQTEGVWTNPAHVLIDRFLLFNQVAAIRREALSKAGFFREDLPFGLNDDYDLSVRLSVIGPWAFVADPLVEWHEHIDNISRTHDELAICSQTIRILEDIDRSPGFRDLLPRRPLNKKLCLLRRKVFAMQLTGQVNPAKRVLGHCIQLYLRLSRACYTRSPLFPRMLTNKV